MMKPPLLLSEKNSCMTYESDAGLTSMSCVERADQPAEKTIDDSPLAADAREDILSRNNSALYTHYVIFSL
jgi:hypothetical protein